MFCSFYLLHYKQVKENKGINLNKKKIIFTIGHSTRSIEEFIDILKKYKINQLIDIRTIPKSYYNKQFNRAALAKALRNRRLGYRHQKNLGGLRHTHADSVNTAWRNASFRGFADYMQTDQFQQGLEKLIKTAHSKNVVIMCAEAVPWRCHRSLIGDALLVHGIRVKDIYSKGSVKNHTLTPWAVVHKKKITYPKRT